MHVSCLAAAATMKNSRGKVAGFMNGACLRAGQLKLMAATGESRSDDSGVLFFYFFIYLFLEKKKEHH